MGRHGGHRLWGYAVGNIKRGIPLPATGEKSLSIEQMQLLQLKDGEGLVLAVHFVAFLADNAKRPMPHD